MQIPILSILDHVGVLVVVLHQANFHRRAVRTAKGDGVGALLLQTLEVQTAADEIAQRLLERLAELPVEVRVDDGVHRRVEGVTLLKQCCLSQLTVFGEALFTA